MLPDTPVRILAVLHGSFKIFKQQIFSCGFWIFHTFFLLLVTCSLLCSADNAGGGDDACICWLAASLWVGSCGRRGKETWLDSQSLWHTWDSEWKFQPQRISSCSLNIVTASVIHRPLASGSWGEHCILHFTGIRVIVKCIEMWGHSTKAVCPNVASGSFSENFKPAWGLLLGLPKHCDYPSYYHLLCIIIIWTLDCLLC